MNNNKPLGIACAVLALICVFIAIERYQTNANNVEAMNQLGGGALGALGGGAELEPAMPTASKYAIVGAAVTALGSVVLLGSGSRR